MTKYIIQISILFIVIIIPHFQYAQTTENDIKLNRNHLLLEAGGAGVYGSLNYEYLFMSTSKNKLLSRIGFFTYTNSYQPNPNLIYHNRNYMIPIGVTYLYGKKNHLEIGLNNSFHIEKNTIDKSKTIGYLIIPTVGYRFENFLKNSIYFNIGVSPWVRYENSIWEIQPSLKVGLGFNF